MTGPTKYMILFSGPEMGKRKWVTRKADVKLTEAVAFVSGKDKGGPGKGGFLNSI